MVCDRSNFEDLRLHVEERQVKFVLALGSIELFIVRDLALNLTMIAFVDLPLSFVDLPLYGRELVGDFWWKNKINCQRCNINVTIIDFLGT